MYDMKHLARLKILEAHAPGREMQHLTFMTARGVISKKLDYVHLHVYTRRLP